MINFNDIKRYYKSYKFIKWLNPTLKMGFSKHDYCVDIENLKILIPIKKRFVDDLLFFDFLFKDYNKFIPNSMIISILHEVGHIKTQDQEKDIVSFALMSKYEDQNNNNEISNLDYTMHYFRTPREKAATNWAVRYYRKNEKKLKKFMN